MIHGLISILIVLSTIIIWGEIRKWIIKRKLKSFSMPRTLPVIGVANRFINKTNEEIVDIIMNIFEEAKTTPAQTWYDNLLTVYLKN